MNSLVCLVFPSEHVLYDLNVWGAVVSTCFLTHPSEKLLFENAIAAKL